MQHTKIIFPALLKVEVIPKLNPTVLKAENISKTNDMNFCSPSVIDNANIDIEIVTSERVMIANALLMEPWEISRPKTSILSFPLAMLTKFKVATANVVVLIPPPVEL